MNKKNNKIENTLSKNVKTEFNFDGLNVTFNRRSIRFRLQRQTDGGVPEKK